MTLVERLRKPAAAAPHLPADGGMWVFVLGDLVIFSSYFVIFMIYRAQRPELFLASQQHLSINFGVVNTLALLTSSWFIARSVLAARAGDSDRAMKLTVGGGLCGVVFIVIKAFEWAAKISQGLTFSSNDFFMFYYLLTGVHLFHVALGLVFLGVNYFELRNPQYRRISMVETGAMYWHLVDMLWIVIFTLLYVLR
ncbi:cytochrome C oxidase subunit III [Mycobacterium sp. 852013-50091_SCH5140682]|uniref:cytochrome c oxidase subunit 3 n=1 Tax=Mycobacterium sp. 852013-50091_SCH5140682 TaxID=1834109 RepID=UPI0007E9AC94|nr:cytochrome c oxidase subunit 3 [Mycobacterium sp. 852013-50091_SCH5140682]OBC01074.1 cytochrome C oxidase subunit III [Mycobacterium sp. 852013-50091_SCH5140682]